MTCLNAPKPVINLTIAKCALKCCKRVFKILAAERLLGQKVLCAYDQLDIELKLLKLH